MNERIVISQAGGFQVDDLAEPRIPNVAKPSVDQSTVINPADQLLARANGNIPPSGANFQDVAIGPLGGGPTALPLLAPEVSSGNVVSAVDHSPVQHANAVSPVPSVTIPAPGGPATAVFEAGLLASRGPGESAGSHPGQPSFPTTTRAGIISFNSPDGLQSVFLGGHQLTTSPQTFADGTTGSLTASFSFNTATGKGSISYSYTLLDNTDSHIASSASFAVVVTDRDGHTNAPGNLVISILDDAPIARPDTDALARGQTTPETGNVLTGQGTTSSGADVQGADGGVTVIGVSAGNGAGGSNPATVGVAVAGAHGLLTLNADGSYSYVHTVGGGTDVFTYTIKDTDGSLSHATLTVSLGNSTPGNIIIPPVNTPGQTQVFEAGLLASRGNGESDGSDAGNPDGRAPTTSSGTITFISPDGVGSVELGSLVLHVGDAPKTDATGLTASVTYDAATGNGVIHYSYTLPDNTLGAPTVSFAVAVTDADGDRTAGGNLVIGIVDDAPIAIADADSVAAGQTAAETGNVITGAGTTSGAADVQGADGSLQVVSAAVGSSVFAVSANTGATIAGAFGVLTLHADGSYSYARATGLPGGNHSDTFTYTTQDADGSRSTATLTIAVTDSSPGGITVPPPDAGETTVFEAGLPARTVGGVAEPAGSNPLAPVTTDSGTITFTSVDGISKIELGGLTLTTPGTEQIFTDATGTLTASYTYDATTGLGEIQYRYTLIDNTIGDPSSVSFAVAVTDTDGDRVAGNNLVINVVDDQSTAQSDIDVVVAGQTTPETGNVLDGIGTVSGDSGADVLGADGATLVGIAAGDSNGNPVAGGVGIQIQGAHGRLTIDALGNYSYVRTGGSGVDVFSYTIQDGDGDLSTATLAITIGDSVPTNLRIPQPGDAGTQVFEAGLLASRGTGESAGSDAGNPDGRAPTATAGSITFTSTDGIGTITLTDANNPNNKIVLDGTTTSQTFTDPAGLYTLSASYTIDGAGVGTITYTFTLLDNADAGLRPNANFTVAVTDPDGDSTSGSLVIGIQDDTPAAHADHDNVAAGQSTAETGNVLTGVGTTEGGANADIAGADGALTVVGVVLGNGTNPVSGGIGTAIAGAFGTLTLNTDGSYSYLHTGRSGGGTDTFTYTTRDADGSLSTATLTVAVADSTPGSITIPPPAGADTTVNEAGLPARTIAGIAEPAGSHAGDPAFPVTTQVGTITFSSPDGASKVELGRLVLTGANPSGTFADATGSLTASFTYDASNGQGTIHYTYTLLDNTLGTQNPSFAVAVTDTDGDRTVGGNLVIGIVDDAPVARADSDSVAAGQTTLEIGNVLTGAGTTSSGADVSGADGGVSVTSVAVGAGASVNVDPTIGVTIGGAFGTLTLLADGSYSYERAIGVPGGANSDVFTYTIKDADGSQSSATLSIAVADSAAGDIAVPPPDQGETTVFEAGLPARIVAGVAEPAGSNPFAPSAVSGAISFTSLDGVSKIELGGLTLDSSNSFSGTIADATGTLTATLSYDATTGQGEIDYIYTLLDNTLGLPSVSFAVAVTDLDGDRTPSDNLTISIVDDAPFALSDTDAVAAGQTTPETGNVITGVGTTSGDSGEDIHGADGAVVAGVAAGDTGVDLVNAGTIGVAIAGAFGTLTLNPDGSYSYVRTGGSGTDVFTYTIRDGDGSLSTTTLAIVIGDSVPTNLHIPQPGDAGTQVFEAGLLASRGSGESDGSNPAAPTETTGSITFNSTDGIGTITLVDNNNPNNTITLDSQNPTRGFIDVNHVYALTATYTLVNGTGTITYDYTLLDNTNAQTIPNASFAVTVTDPDGDSTSGNLVININDDAPIAHADHDNVAAGQTTAETGNVLDGTGTVEGTANADIAGADGGLSVVGILSNNTNVIGTVGSALHGQFGTLAIDAQGHYSYARDAGPLPGGVTDTFTYTIHDADGSRSTATLAVSLGDSAPGNITIPTEGDAGTVVMEAGLPRGSHAADLSFPITVSGSITFNSLDGVLGIALVDITNSDNKIDLNFIFTSGASTDATGTLTASYTYDAATGNGEIDYRYTLLNSVIGDPAMDGNSQKIFAVSITDIDFDRTSRDLGILILDDAPVAKADLFVARNPVEEIGNVFTGAGAFTPGVDLPGADGGLRVVGVAAGDTGVNLVDPSTVGPGGNGVITDVGVMHLSADGNFDYFHDPEPTTDADTFTYTIMDADGSLSHTTVTFILGSTQNIIAGTAKSAIEDQTAPDHSDVAANHFLFNAPSDGDGHILDFKHGSDSIDVLLAGFAGLSGKGAVAGSDFVASNNAATANLGAAHFAYNQSNGQLFYDSNGGDASGASRMLLAILDNHAALAATDIHKV